MPVQKIDPKIIFASNAPAQDKPAAFVGYEKGMDATRSNEGRPTIKQANYLQQTTDQKILWMHENGAALPYDETIDYADGAIVKKDGILQEFFDGEWISLEKPLTAENVTDGNQTQDQINLYGGKRYDMPVGGYPVGAVVVLDNGEHVRSTIAGNTNNPNTDMTGWAFPKPNVYLSDFNVAPDEAIDNSSVFQGIVNLAKARNAKLIIDSIFPDTVYAVMNVDITGLTVDVSENVSFVPPLIATIEPCFIARGSAGNLAKPTKLFNAVLDAKGRGGGLLKGEYIDQPLAHNCSAKNMPIDTATDASGVMFKECYKPRVTRGFYNGGKYGVLFNSCTNPVSEDVETDYQGRDGVLFLTSKTGTTTTDAVAINCKTTRFCVNGEDGRGGVHFYGVRRASATLTIGGTDNGVPPAGSGALRFRDCEDYYAEGYNFQDIVTGVLVQVVGDYAAAPHNIQIRGAIGKGTVKNASYYGICMATLDAPGEIIGATVIDSAKTTGGVGIYFYANGSLVGNTIDTTTAGHGVQASGDQTITGNTLKNAGSIGVAQLRLESDKRYTVSGNNFENTDGKSAGAIRATGASKLIVGPNNFDDNITLQLNLAATTTLLKGSALIKTQFGGVPSITGIFENGVQLIDANGIVYLREANAWRRQNPRNLSTVAISTTETSIAHGLGYAPKNIGLVPLSSGSIWQTKAADATNIYLAASASTTANIAVF